MKIVVCCKAVPGIVADVKVQSDGKGIQYQGQFLAMNECNKAALEEALILKRTHGGEVTVLTMGSMDFPYRCTAPGIPFPAKWES